MNQSQIAKAQAFQQLHHASKILVLLNCWDAASARVFELAGAPAVATTSSGLAAANGYPDGQHITRDRLFDAVRRVTRVVNVPLTVDLETGYGSTAADVCETVRAVVDAGAIGMNIEDATEPPVVLADKIKGVRELANRIGLRFFVNARTDVYLRRLGAEDGRFDETIRRIKTYATAGADGAFVPGVTDSATIRRIAKESPLPLNVMLAPGLPPAPELQGLGVARLSIGGAAAFAALSLARKIAQELLTTGTYDAFTSNPPIPHPEVMKMFSAQ
ncbi:MAG TPA: isocitrate lyase/phosphoenolpyruvate mutase family protein [Candidatus Binataceae bacterium]